MGRVLHSHPITGETMNDVMSLITSTCSKQLSVEWVVGDVEKHLGTTADAAGSSAALLRDYCTQHTQDEHARTTTS